MYGLGLLNERRRGGKPKRSEGAKYAATMRGKPTEYSASETIPRELQTAILGDPSEAEETLKYAGGGEEPSVLA